MSGQDKVDQEMRAAWSALVATCNRADHTVAHWLVNAAIRETQAKLTEAEGEVIRAERFPGELVTDTLGLGSVPETPTSRATEAMEAVTRARAQLRFLLALARKLDGVAAAEFGRAFAAYVRGQKPGALQKGGA